MAKKLDRKAAILAAAQGSGAVFEALNDDVEVQAEPAEQIKPAATAAAAAAPEPKETPKMSTQFAQMEMPKVDLNAAADGMRKMFASTGIKADGFDAKTLVERSQKMASEAAELARGNVEAMAASARIAAQNAGTLSQDVAELGRKGFEGASEAMKSFAEAKSPVELLRLQGEFAKTYMETVMSEGARLSETILKLAGEAIEPVSTRMTANADKVKSLGN